MNARVRIFLLGMLSLLLYASITWLSYAFIYGQRHRQRPVLSFIGLYAGAFLLYLLALKVLPRLPKPRVDMWLILGFAVLFRITLLFSHPIQEDDFYRYLWDGKVVASGLNPYSIAPLVVRERREETDRLRAYTRIPAEDSTFALILSRVNHPAVPTIYPPLAQAVFGLSALVAPGSLLALRLVFLGFDLGTCGLLWLMLRSLGISPAWVFVYAWSPLVIKESVNSAHYDAVPTFFLVLSLLLIMRRSSLVAHASLALAVLGKVYPLLVIPVFVWRAWKTVGRTQAVLGLGVVALVITLGYAPFLDAGPLLWQGTLTFAERWETNSLVFPLLRSLLGERWLTSVVVGLLLGGIEWALLYRFDLRDERSFVWVNFCMLSTFFLLSPVGNPWYFLWLVPFLCIFPLRSWLLLSGLLGLYYLAFYLIYRDVAETFRWVIWLEYLPFYSLLVWEWLKMRENLHKA